MDSQQISARGEFCLQISPRAEICSAAGGESQSPRLQNCAVNELGESRIPRIPGFATPIPTCNAHVTPRRNSNSGFWILDFCRALHAARASAKHATAACREIAPRFCATADPDSGFWILRILQFCKYKVAVRAPVRGGVNPNACELFPDVLPNRIPSCVVGLTLTHVN